MKTSSKVSMREETSDISVWWLVADKGRNSSHLAILLYNVDHHINHNVHLGPVVRKPISANPGLKVNREFNFFYIEVF